MNAGLTGNKNDDHEWNMDWTVGITTNAMSGDIQNGVVRRLCITAETLCSSLLELAIIHRAVMQSWAGWSCEYSRNLLPEHGRDRDEDDFSL